MSNGGMAGPDCGVLTFSTPTSPWSPNGCSARCTTLDCASVAFLTDGLLDDLPRPAQLGATRVGGKTGTHPPIPRASPRPCTITAITALRDRVLAPMLSGARKPSRVTNHQNWTPVEHHYENLRVEIETLLRDLGIATAA
jgi:hypothetical protein